MQIGRKRDGSSPKFHLQWKSRKNKKNKNFGQTRKKHAKMGMDACIYAGLTAFVLILAILIAYVTHGTSAVYIGLMGILAIISAGRGIYAAVKGFRERDKNYITCKIGMGVNIFFLVCLLFIYIGGMM